MQKLSSTVLMGALLACFGLLGSSADGAELEGALQYPPPSAGLDAQPPPPARMVPQPVSPRRIEMGVSGTSTPSDTWRFYIRPALRSGSPVEPAPTEAGGN
jgi:hypothetical protein